MFTPDAEPPCSTVHLSDVVGHRKDIMANQIMSLNLHQNKVGFLFCRGFSCLFWLVGVRVFFILSLIFSPLLQQTQSLFASFDTFFSPAIFLLCVGTWILFDYKRIKHSTTLKTVFLFSILFLLYFFYVPLQWLLTYQAQVFVFFKWSRSPDSTGNRSTAWTEEPTVALNSVW